VQLTKADRMSDESDGQAAAPEPKPSDVEGAAPEPKPSDGKQSKPARTQSDRAEQKRQEKLDMIRDQLDSGQLTIRKMTPAERKEHPPRPRPPKRGRS
jgi:hypothetical protein